MKKIKQTMMALLGAIAMTACSGGGASSESCMVFGEVPAIYADYQAQRDKIEESAQKSEASYKKASSQIDELKEQYRAKIEEAGKKLDGQPIEITPGEEFKVVSPVSLSFKEFANSVNSMYDVKGEIEVAKDINIDVAESWLRSHDVQYLMLPLMLIGCDEQGTEVTSARIGYFKGFKVVDGKLVLPAGTKADLETVAYSDNDYDNYVRVKSVTLALDLKKVD